MKVLIVSVYCPPFNFAGSLRVGRIAEHLSKLGHEVKLVAASDVTDDRSIGELKGVQVSFVDWVDVNDGPRKLAGGRKKTVSLTQSNRKYLSMKGRLLLTAAKAYRDFTNIPDGFTKWVKPASKQAAEVCREWRPDIVYASILPPSAALVAKKISSEFSVPWICELRDLWADNHYYSFSRWRKTLDNAIEKRTLKTASGFVTVSEPLAATLRAKYPGKPCEVILNGADTEAIESFAAEEPPHGSTTLNIVYTGSLYKGKRDPSMLFEAIRGLEGREQGRDIHVHFYGQDSSLYIGELAKEHDVERFVTCHGKVGYLKALNAQRNADLLLLLLWMDDSEVGVFTGKLFEYIGSKRPVVAIGPKGNVAMQLIQERNLGCAADSVSELSVFLEASLEQKQSGGIEPLGQEAIKGLTRIDQSKELEKFILKTIASTDR